MSAVTMTRMTSKWQQSFTNRHRDMASQSRRPKRKRIVRQAAKTVIWRHAPIFDAADDHHGQRDGTVDKLLPVLAASTALADTSSDAMQQSNRRDKRGIKSMEWPR
ncbi:uncharacterized protein SPSK_02855 [Sporothrix schenckii 1099-18]|uniref:Uncharacterized protein n=1 Tax=Sporothrix schenckii 1099-18 TaxID=1397361 RepID=A0A0F2M948_SPOSC|nr:uncharacterized protein SPSK_02855 [Sporothrix schenckii 1099-18]KJR86228.1 hypothetical protein SPSK_02855 [Sporothrix schenckii 1099-18]